jgi:Ca2+-binding EF-hand superfamily protein|nr:MAG TPA: Calbindin-HAND, CA2+-BINDING, METAL BINDING PROTEIN [Caudoviricetes sp.]
MTKEKYVIQTELETKKALSDAKTLQKEINEIGRVAKSASKNAKITGKVEMKDKAIKDTERALLLAKKNVDQLTQSLAKVKLNGGTEKQVSSLESQLRKAQISANNLESELHQLKGVDVTPRGLDKFKSMFSGGVGKIKSFGSGLLDIGSKFSMIFTAVSSGVSMVSNGIGKAVDLVGGFANRLMNTYDTQLSAQKSLSVTLADGAKGYEDFNSHIEKGSLLLQSQRNDLAELASFISGYVKVTGDEAFEIVNAINTVGDSLGLSMDTQKQFTYGLSQALGAGVLHAQDFNQIMQSALGAQFRDMLIQAYNEINNTSIGMEEFKQAMEDGKVNTEVMNLALEKFKQQAENTANSGQITFAQMREMITKGFDTSALSGFQSELQSAGFSMGELGGTATNLSMLVGEKMGQIAGYVVNNMIKLMDANGDGKVSNEELGKAFDKVAGKVSDAYYEVRNWLKQINWADVSGFISDIGSIISSLADLIGWIQDAIGWFQKLFDKKRMADNIAAAGGHSGSGGGRDWLVSPMLASDFDDTLQGVTEKIYGSMSKPLGMHLQLFGNYDKATQNLLSNVPVGFNGSIGTRNSQATYDQSQNKVNINVYGNDADKIAKDIYSKLERNGIKLTRR